MNTYVLIFLITSLTGAGGLALGGALAAAVRNPSGRAVSLLLRFTAGVTPYAVRVASQAGLRTVGVLDPFFPQKHQALREICTRTISRYSELL